MTTPRLIDQITDLIGHQATLELVRAWGGRRLYVPKSYRPDSPIALRIGASAAEALTRWGGGYTIELPVERNAMIRLRDQAIVARLDAGESPREVAIEYGLSASHVRHIRDVQNRKT